ncbi:MAG: ABC transporter ATP-binding protein [Gemmataceae bacterium]
MPQLSIQNLSLAGRLADVTLDIAAGEHLLVAGPSGAGKTTLLRLIAGLESPDTGQLLIDGRNATREPPHRRGVALVAQRPALYSHLTVRRNLAIGVELRKPRPAAAEIASRVAEAADLLGLTSLLDRRPHELSGGEQQRVALGRAWACRAGLWLLDEPFGHLNPALRQQVRDRTYSLRERASATTVEVTHDPTEARGHAGRVAVLGGGQLEQVGIASDLYDRPATRTVAEALADVPANVAEGVAGPCGLTVAPEMTLPLPGQDWPAGRSLCLLVRPEHIMIGGLPHGTLPLGDWRVCRAAPRGPAWLVSVERAGFVWRLWRPDPGPPTGATLSLAVPARASFVFDGTNGRRLWP